MIVGTSSLGKDETCSILLVGDSGTGKTTCAAKFPKTAFVLLESNGRSSIEQAAPGTLTLLCENYEDILEAVTWLENNTDQYDTVVFDSGSELDDFVTAKIMKDTGLDFLQIQDYKTVGVLSKRVINKVKSLSATCVFLYLEDVKEYSDGEVKHVPLASGKSWQAHIPSLFSFVLKTTKFLGEDANGREVPKFALETCSDENTTLKVPPALQRGKLIPADPKKWLGLLMPSRYPALVPNNKQAKKGKE